jgi:hypothetical protein
MTALANAPKAQTPTVGKRTELGRYRLPDGPERILYGQSVDGVVRVTDNPARGRGRAYLVERELEQDGNAALRALIDDYLAVASQLGTIPMADSPINSDLLR